MSGSSRSGASIGSPERERTRSDVRLFVANLSPIVSEHDLMSFFRAQGQLVRLDLVFQRSGPQKGQHKGYAFVEFQTAREAESARASLDGKHLRGREVRINYATANATEGREVQSTSSKRMRRPFYEEEAANRHTLLSLSKNLNRKDSTTSKIAAMEAKLAALQKRDEQSSSVQNPERRSKLAQRPAHLPPKPSSR